MSTNVPATVWRNTSGFGEYSNGSVNSIVDTTGTQLVDTGGVSIVDTGILFTNIPATVWVENDAS